VQRGKWIASGSGSGGRGGGSRGDIPLGSEEGHGTRLVGVRVGVCVRDGLGCDWVDTRIVTSTSTGVAAVVVVAVARGASSSCRGVED
jgi:hypothetical protein